MWNQLACNWYWVLINCWISVTEIISLFVSIEAADSCAKTLYGNYTICELIRAILRSSSTDKYWIDSESTAIHYYNLPYIQNNSSTSTAYHYPFSYFSGDIVIHQEKEKRRNWFCLSKYLTLHQIFWFASVLVASTQTVEVEPIFDETQFDSIRLINSVATRALSRRRISAIVLSTSMPK